MSDQDRSRNASIWMMLFSIVGLLLLYKQDHLSGWSMLWTRHSMQIDLFVLIFVVGLLRMPPSRFGGKKLSLGALLKTYSEAWNQMLQHKWILWVFGGWGLVHFLGALAQYPITSRIMEYRPRHLESNSLSNLRFMWPRAFDSVPTQAYTRWGAGFSLRGDTGTFALAGLVFLLASIGLWNRLKSLRAVPECASGAGLLQTLLLPIAIMWIGTAVAIVRSQLAFISSLFASPTKLTFTIPSGSGASIMAQPFGPTGVFSGERNPLWDLVPILFGIYTVLLVTLLVAGFAGSLKRLRSSQQVTVDTFLKDMILFWKPLVGIYLLMLAVVYSFGFIPYLRLPFLSNTIFLNTIWYYVTPALMFIPYAVVIYGVGAWPAIRLGLRDFFCNAWDAVSFIALGLTIVSIPILCQELLRQIIGQSGFALYAAVAALSAVITALITAFVSVAIWEFYSGLTAVSSSAATMEQAAETSTNE